MALNEGIQNSLNVLGGVALARKDPVMSLMVGLINTAFGSVDILTTLAEQSQQKMEALEKVVGIIPVATYADLVAYPNPGRPTFFSVTSDAQNNNGNTSIYSKNEVGEIIWFAAQKMI